MAKYSSFPEDPDLDSDSESDVELGLVELDPIQENRVPTHHDFSRRIPLRTLRASRIERMRRPSSEDGDAGDTTSLLSARLGSELEDPIPLTRTPSHQILSVLDRLAVFAGMKPSAKSHNEQHDEPEAEHDPTSNRTIAVGARQQTRYPINAISNSRYSPWAFLPRTLYNEFKFFINLYFLLVALSQVIPALRIGYLYTYILPLSGVMTITLGKEAYDDVIRRKRDREANSEPYALIQFGSPNSRQITKHTDPSKPLKYYQVLKPSRDIKVGDIVKLGKNQRVPADMVLISSRQFSDISTSSVQSRRPSQTLFEDEDDNSNTPARDTEIDSKSDTSDEVFIRTDQLDGETDWKLRLASPLSQTLPIHQFSQLRIVAGKPDRKVNKFVGTLSLISDTDQNQDPLSPEHKSAPLNVDNTAWANTVIASSSAVYGAVIYTGVQTRQAMSTTASRAKIGLLEIEINNLSKILCVLTVSLSLLLVFLGNFNHHDSVRPWYISALRFLILFSTVIPISLRVNLDWGKLVYARYIERDQSIPNTVVRTSTIPEELGRIEYLLTDKTGTLTQNEMDLKRIHVGTVSYANEAMEEVSAYVNQAFSGQNLVTPSSSFHLPTVSATRTRREISSRVKNLVLALAICHNVTPTIDDGPDGQPITSYQASSPDEIAIVEWTEAVGLKLKHRDRNSMILQSAKTGSIVVRVSILNIFPFTSDSKRMGLLVKFITNDQDRKVAGSGEPEIWFYQKGADTVMSEIVISSDWLKEETDNMAREGLRTLVVGRKKLSTHQYEDFMKQHRQASLILHGRDAAMAEVVRTHLERDLELLGVTGVEDKLQKDVKRSLELLRDAGIKIWMLTGDKVETARCVAVNSRLINRGQPIRTITRLRRKDAALESLQLISANNSAALLIDGESLAIMLQHHAQEFIAAAARLPTVIACRVSPIQKAELANLIKNYSRKRICCIGDGGNDVSMIQAADVGVGIVGKEGKQASLAADFSLMQFHYLTKLLLWHGRNSYKRSAKLAQFVIHRGVVMSVCQAMFTIASKFEPYALYRDWLMVGYATVYTFAPVFSLVLDRDVDEVQSTLYPELYKELTSGQSLSYMTFFIWLGVSIYQGCMIQGLSELLIANSLVENFKQMVGLSYIALVLNELFMVAIEVTRWHFVMIAAIVLTLSGFVATLPFMEDYMDTSYIVTVDFSWRISVILAVSLIPIYLAKIISRKIRPPTYRKVMHV